MKDKITYSKCGDYYIPDLTIPDTKKYIIGKYGRLRRQFLKEHHKSFYTALMIEGKLEMSIKVQSKFTESIPNFV